MVDEPAPIRSSYLPVLVYTPIVLARQRGHYERFGISAETVQLAAGSEAIPALLAGDLEIAVCGPGPNYWQAIDQGHDLRIIAPLHAERPPATTPLVVRSDLFDSGEIDTVADLRGRPVASPSPGVPLYWLALALESGGLTLADVELRDIPYTRIGEAFAAGEVDAALFGEPLATALIEQGLIARLASDFVDGLQATYLSTRGSILRERRDEIVRFVAAYLQACRDLESADNQRNWASPETVALIASFTHTPEYDVMDVVRPRYEPDGRFREGSLERLYEFFIAQGMISPIPNFKPASLIEHSVTRDARSLLEESQ